MSGTVEVDETYIGGEEPGLRGGRQRGKKVLTGIAVEVREPKGIGRCRMAPLDDASGDTLAAFVRENVQPGAKVITDGWAAYRAISGQGYQHRPINQKAARAAGEDPDSLLPAVHRVASLCKRWLLGTHQGSVDAAHLPAYLNEFVFRFNRRRSASRGMVFYRVLELAAGHEPVRYADLLASKKPRRAKRARGGTGHPPSLERPAADRPWRTAEMQLQLPVRLSGYPSPGFGERKGLRAGLRTRQGRAAPGEGKLLSGHAQQVRVGGRGRPADRSQASRCGSRLAGQAAPGALASAGAWAQVGVDLTGDVTLEAADDLFLGQALFAAPGDVGAGGRVGAHPGDHDPVQGVVGLAVAAWVEPVAGDFPEEAGMGVVAQRCAQAASERSRSGWSPAAIRSLAAVSWPTPYRANRPGGGRSPAG